MPSTEDAGNGDDRAQVIVVGAGPAGSAAALFLARAGVDVLLLEKSAFPRDKVCGDGLTPRGVQQLVRMGIDIDAPGWTRTRGMRWVCQGRQVHIDWPRSGSAPDFGLTRSRHDFDDLLVRRAVAAGARLCSQTKATGPLTDRAGRITGVSALVGADRRPKDFHAPLVVAADGASARTALAMGLERDPRMPIATAGRRYYRSEARTHDPYLELWADLLCPRTGRDLPGYGWIFPLGDGRVNVGLGALPHRGPGAVDLRATMDRWLERLPGHWGLQEANADSPFRSAALPMGFNRRPQYHRGLLLVGDSAGMVSPWSGEGIVQAMEAGEAAAETIALALHRAPGPGREQVLRRYPREIERRWGRYYRLGNTTAGLVFARFGYRPLLNRHVMASPALVRTLARLLTHGTDAPAGDLTDTVVSGLVRMVPLPGRRAGTGPR
ncbi:geranylgeranyl reductase family protein [Streptomyces nitrosporeus]|uniref:Geranylgeranyl reductase family protein n=1 Tax=Streptomyces nitrosporeus TaxID=28894 RepID=A0A5J6FI37_9ACTN|nr:geranylgeranyl reductase family protein [Streptomyces nitrosporeus]QEU75992.1 geranylgeranyl reductase family protein [Streptomyces nitrosporeus]GGZ24181.1 drug:proton antiporter [Streptomyces nitrosporeus]